MRVNTNLKPCIQRYGYERWEEGRLREKVESGYIIDCVNDRLLLRKWPAAYFQAPKQASLPGLKSIRQTAFSSDWLS